MNKKYKVSKNIWKSVDMNVKLCETFLWCEFKRFQP